MQLLGDWLVAALLSLSNLLAVGVLAAAALGERTLDISLVAAFVAATVGSLLVAWLAFAAATPTSRLAVETMPSLAPSTAARSQPMREVRCLSMCRIVSRRLNLS